MEEKYIEYANNRFKGKSLELILSQIKDFYSDETIDYTKYSENEEVFLKKGTFIHGISQGIKNFDWVVKNGFIGNDFTNLSETKNKIRNSIGMWNIKEDMFLKDYIQEYSGFTISYVVGKGEDCKTVSKLIPYHKFDEITENINNEEQIWTYWGNQTKEVRFIPSLVSNKRQIAFILNMESNYARKMSIADVWNLNIEDEIIKDFVDTRYYDKFIEERKNRDATTTDRESAIMFGLPTKLIEGVLVGRKVEKDTKMLEHIKEKLPNRYICNLDGKVIIGNNK